jgi:hypothetical protein
MEAPRSGGDMHTALNHPYERFSGVRPPSIMTAAIVITAVVVALVLLAGIFYFVYRDIPMTGKPGTIDQAEGVTPRYPPTTPALPW